MEVKLMVLSMPILTINMVKKL